MIAGYVGPIGPTSQRSTEPPIYALTVPLEYALDELSFQFSRKGWGYLTREEFTAALKGDGIQGFTTRSPEAAGEKRQQDALRQWRNRRAA